MADQNIRWSISSWLIRHARRIFQFGIGFAAFEAFVHLYDFIFFPYAIAKWGGVWGAVIAVGGAFTLNALVYWLYDAMKIDWLQAYATRELAEKENKTKLEKFATWFRTEKRTFSEKLFSVFIFVILTLPIDPIIVALYYRQNYFKGVSLRDWGLLLAASASSCLLWLVVWEPGVLLLKIILNHLHVTL